MHAAFTGFGPAGQLIGPVAAARDVADDANRALCRREGGAQGVPGFWLDAGGLVDDGGPDVLAVERVRVFAAPTPDGGAVGQEDGGVGFARPRDAPGQAGERELPRPACEAILTWLPLPLCRWTGERGL